MKKGEWIGMLPWYLLVGVLTIGLAHSGSRAVTTASEGRPVEREVVYIIDAGHGGVDGGTTSVSGVLEKQINLEIALRLDALMHLLGHETILIRDSDISVYTEGETIAAKKVSDLKERVRIVNETDKACLISIHQNFFADSRYRGAQVFYAATEGSREMAERLQQSFNHVSMSNRSAKKAIGIYLMDHVLAPAILIECGFLSNPQEDALLQTPEYQQKLCCVIAAGICSEGNT